MRKVFTVGLTLLFTPLLVGCGGNIPEIEPEKTYTVASRKLPPEPIYNRLRWVHLPEMYPSLLPQVEEERPRLFPVFHFTLEDKPLCDAAALLAGTSRYSSYCSSLLKEEMITLTASGTVDELAALIEEQTSARVVVDHINREVRFFLDADAQEYFFSMGEEVTDEP